MFHGIFICSVTVNRPMLCQYAWIMAYHDFKWCFHTSFLSSSTLYFRSMPFNDVVINVILNFLRNSVTIPFLYKSYDQCKDFLVLLKALHRRMVFGKKLKKKITLKRWTLNGFVCCIKKKRMDKKLQKRVQAHKRAVDQCEWRRVKKFYKVFSL